MKKLEADLVELRQRVIAMGNLAEKMVVSAVDALTAPGRDELIKQVVLDEEELDQMQLKLDKEAIRLLTVFSPVATDLRFVMAVSKITAGLERMGDHAINMCEGIQLLAAKTNAQPLPLLLKMADVVRNMVGDSLNSFMQNDIQKAQATIASDDLVDAINDQLIEELLSDQLVREAAAGPKDIATALAQLLIGRSLERIGDQSTNVSEEVVYMVKGLDIRHQRHSYIAS